MLESDVMPRLFFEGVVGVAKERGLMNAEHFTVDGTLIEAWASLKSFQKEEQQGAQAARRSGQPDREFSR